MNIATLDPFSTQDHRRRFLTRPGWLVRLARLGRLAGADYMLVGVIADVDVDAGEAGIVYGIADTSAVSRIETEIGSLAAVMDRVATIRIMAETTHSPRLAGLGKDADAASQRHSIPVFEEWIDPQRFPATSEEPRLYGAYLEQQKAKADFVRRRELALGLRQQWSIAEMNHRRDWPAWLPPWCCEVIREHSRHWIELPPAPVPDAKTRALKA
jgi:hypothetical protein